MPITITVADVRQLLNADQHEAVLYIDLDDAGNPEKIDTWVAAYVQNHHIIISRADLVDWIGGDVTDEDITMYLDELQETVDGAVERATV